MTNKTNLQIILFGCLFVLMCSALGYYLADRLVTLYPVIRTQNEKVETTTKSDYPDFQPGEVWGDNTSEKNPFDSQPSRIYIFDRKGDWIQYCHTAPCTKNLVWTSKIKDKFMYNVKEN
jgi:hypothetical protein